MSGRRWTGRELSILRFEYGQVPGATLARWLGRTLSQVYQAAVRAGLAQQGHQLSPAQREEVRRLHAQHLTDREIAERLGFNRHVIGKCRRALGLAPHWRLIYQCCLRAQLRSMGLSSAGQLRARSFRRYALQNGWPADLRPREVQVLNALARHGPMTRLQIAEVIGMRTDLKLPHGGPKLLVGNGPGGTYVATLMRRGLITYLHRAHSSGRQGIGRLPGLYVLTTAALALLEKHHGKHAQAQ